MECVMVRIQIHLSFLFCIANSIITFPLLSQSLISINKLLIPAMEEGWMEVSEAEEIRVHLEKYGWPVVPEEVWAISGLRQECSDRLLKSPKWRTWCEWGKEEGMGNS